MPAPRPLIGLFRSCHNDGNSHRYGKAALCTVPSSPPVCASGLTLLLLLASVLAARRRRTALPSFTSDVMAVLSKAGCNAGTCHGNQNGKGGFKLSLRGQDPAADFLALTRDQFGRRANPLDPEQSLVLLKPAMQVAHEGGLRLKRDRRSTNSCPVGSRAECPPIRAAHRAGADRGRAGEQISSRPLGRCRNRRCRCPFQQRRAGRHERCARLRSRLSPTAARADAVGGV